MLRPIGLLALALTFVLVPAAQARPSIASSRSLSLNASARSATLIVAASHARKVTVKLVGSGGCAVAGACSSQDPATSATIHLKHRRGSKWSKVITGAAFGVAAKNNVTLSVKACARSCSSKRLAPIAQGVVEPVVTTPTTTPAPTPTPNPTPTPPSGGSSPSPGAPQTTGIDWASLLSAPHTNWYLRLETGLRCAVLQFQHVGSGPNYEGVDDEYSGTAPDCSNPQFTHRLLFTWRVDGDILTTTFSNGTPAAPHQLRSYDANADVIAFTDPGESDTDPAHLFGCHSSINPFRCPS